MCVPNKRRLSKFLLDRLPRESGRAHRVELVAEDTHDLRGYSVIQEGDGVLHLTPVVLRDGSFAEMLASPATDLLDVA